MVVTQYYLEQRPLTEIAQSLGVTQSRASQLRSEGLDLLREALERLWVATPGNTVPRQRSGAVASSPGDGGDGAGARSRRREAYVQAVASRSRSGQRANVQAYLDGEPLQSLGRF